MLRDVTERFLQPLRVAEGLLQTSTHGARPRRGAGSPARLSKTMKNLTFFEGFPIQKTKKNKAICTLPPPRALLLPLSKNTCAGNRTGDRGVRSLRPSSITTRPSGRDLLPFLGSSLATGCSALAGLLGRCRGAVEELFGSCLATGRSSYCIYIYIDIILSKYLI